MKMRPCTNHQPAFTANSASDYRRAAEGASTACCGDEGSAEYQVQHSTTNTWSTSNVTTTQRMVHSVAVDNTFQRSVLQQPWTYHAVNINECRQTSVPQAEVRFLSSCESMGVRGISCGSMLAGLVDNAVIIISVLRHTIQMLPSRG